MAAGRNSRIAYIPDMVSDPYSHALPDMQPAQMGIKRGVSSRMADTDKPAVASAVSGRDYRPIAGTEYRFPTGCGQIHSPVETPFPFHRMYPASETG